MEKIRIKNLEEDVYYEKLDNGLEVYLYTKDDIYTNYVTFTTKYGSVYNDFVPIGESKIRSFPKGIAHFLEHKVFTEKEDPQPMEFFAKSGSLCNAYTTFRNTSYLFYATKDLKENIEYLLNYVQNIYLTEDDVEKEKGIISEEIHMYEDRPGDVLFEKVRLNTLNSSPYRNSIIGTVKDIESIIRPIGTYKKKAIFIKEIVNRLISDNIKIIPNDREYLSSLPGVGRKTINVFLSVIYNEPLVAVDTHVNRVSKRLDLADEDDNVLEVENKLNYLFPKDSLSKIHHQLVFFGRYKCKSINPLCDDCKLKDICKYYSMHSKSK